MLDGIENSSPGAIRFEEKFARVVGIFTSGAA
jgi:hypothetical protein